MSSTTVLTPERLTYDLVSAGSAEIAPDGSRIVFVKGTTDEATQSGTSHLWFIDPDGKNLQQVTHTGTSHSNPVWSPDGSQIAFVSKRGEDDEQPNAICVLPVKGGGEARILTRHAQSPTGLSWSPDGSKLAYSVPVDPDNPSEKPRESKAPAVRVIRRIDYKQDNIGFINDVRRQIFVVDVASGEREQLTGKPVDHTFPVWSPDGQQLAVKVTYLTAMKSYLGLLSLTDHTVSEVGSGFGSVGTYAWSVNGDFILFDGDQEQTPQNDYFRYDVATAEVTRLTDDLHFSPEAGRPTLAGPSHPIWLSRSYALVAGAYKGASGLWTIDAYTGEIEGGVECKATQNGLSTDDERRYVVQSVTSLDGTGDLTVLDRGTGESKRITCFNDDLFAETPVAQWEALQIERNGFTIDAWVLKPADFDESKSYPLVLDVHGGPHGAYGYQFNANQQILASNGFIVVASNPRGSGTYGREFAEAVRGDWGGEDWLDLLAIVDKVQERPYVDAARTGIYGYSYGGYMTSWAIGQTDRFAAAVCGAPVFDLESFYGTADIGHYFGENQWGGPPSEVPDFMRDRSPSTHIHNATTPTMVIHGEADDRCPIGQGEQMFTALMKQGVKTEFVRYPGGSHLMLRSGPPEHRADFYGRILGWFKDHLGGPTGG